MVREMKQPPAAPVTKDQQWDMGYSQSPAQELRPSFLPCFCTFTFEPGSRFEQGLLECHVEVEIESFVFSNVISHSGKQDKVVEALSHALLQVRGKNPSRKGDSELQESLAEMVYSRGFIVRQGDIIS